MIQENMKHECHARPSLTTTPPQMYGEYLQNAV